MEGSRLGYGGTKKKRKAEKGPPDRFLLPFWKLLFSPFFYYFIYGRSLQNYPYDTRSTRLRYCDLFYNFSLFHISFLCTSSVCDVLRGGGGGDLFVRFAFPVPRKCGLT